MPLLEVTGLDVDVGEAALLTGVELVLEPGERVALTGPSGSGKTTLLRTLATLRDPTRGAMRLAGQAPSAWGYPTWRRHVSYLAQRPVLADATVRENLARPFRYKSIGADFSARDAEALLEQLSLPSGLLDRAALTLSEGQQQRVALARTLLVVPRVLLLDEPSSALDPAAAESVETVLERWVATDERAIVWVTHDPAQAARACDRRVDLEAFLAGARGPSNHLEAEHA